MELARIERYVGDLMTVSGVEKEGKEQNVGLALYHLLMSASLHDLMSDDEKDLFKALTKKLQFFFCTRSSLKERKRNKEKKIIPPNSLLKEKEKTEKEEKPLSLKVGAKEAFYRECQARLGQYDEQQLADFYNWWSEENEKGQMRFQTERYWNIDNRLKRWVKNKYSAENTAAAMRLKRAKKQQAVEADAHERQQTVAKERTDDNARLEQEIEERKRNAVSYEEWLASKRKQT